MFQHGYHMKTTLRRMGNSHGLIIPKPLLADIGLVEGDTVDIKLKKGKLVVIPVDRDPRAAWAAECDAVASAGEDALVWPDFANDADKTVEW